MTDDAQIPSVSLLPDTLPKEELFWHWRRGIAPYFDSVPLADPRHPPQVPKIHLYNVGGFLFFDTTFSRQKFVRNAAWLRRNDDSDHVGLQMYLRGRNQVENGGRDYTISPGGIYAVNLGYEVDASCTDAEVLSIILPRTWLNENLPGLDSARGLILAGDSTAGRLFGDFMMSLRRNLPHATQVDVPVLSASLLGLLQVFLADGDPASADAKRGIFATMASYIDRNLAAPDLGVDHLCARFKVSRATLYRLFAHDGGVRRHIQRRRLMGCFKALTEQSQIGRGIFEVALDFGFSSPSFLAARFRREFGMSPSEVREAAASFHARGETALTSDLGSGLSDTELMQRWTRELGATPPQSGPRQSGPRQTGPQIAR